MGPRKETPTKAKAKKATGPSDAKFDIKGPVGQELQRFMALSQKNRYMEPKKIWNSNELFYNSGISDHSFRSAVYRIRTALNSEDADDSAEEGDNRDNGTYLSLIREISFV